MIRVFRLASLLLVVPVLPAGAADLPYFAGGELPSLKATGSPDYESAPSNPWTGLTMGASVFGVSGSGRGARGGFGGETFIGYSHEFDNRVVVGVQGSVGTLPGLYKYGPSGYNFGMANISVGYDMGRLMPYVNFGVGTASATNLRGLRGFDSVNNIFSHSGQQTTLTSVGAGFNYAVTDNLRVGVEVSAVHQHGGFGPVLVPQPGALP
jgi:opacity protein-like surface antigen